MDTRVFVRILFNNNKQCFLLNIRKAFLSPDEPELNRFELGIIGLHQIQQKTFFMNPISQPPRAGLFFLSFTWRRSLLNNGFKQQADKYCFIIFEMNEKLYLSKYLVSSTAAFDFVIWDKVFITETSSLTSGGIGFNNAATRSPATLWN